MEPICDLNLIIMAAQSSYRVKENSKIDTKNPKYKQALDNIDNQGYELIHSVSPKSSKGTGETPLAATCLAPKEKAEGPIVISFRGTKEARDLYSDVTLTVFGTADNKLRDAAFKYYQKVREQHPGREIILTGHSLGGNLAQDVASRAYSTSTEEKNSGLIHVRTFNSAPIRTENSKVFKEKPMLADNFKNYRLEADKVSKLNYMASVGDVFTLRMETGFDLSKRVFGHGMPLVEKYFPKELLKQRVGSSKEASCSLSALSEVISGSLHSYECRVKGKWFAPLRAGYKDLVKMRDMEVKALKSLSHGNFDEAIAALNNSKMEVKTESTKKLIDTLIEQVNIQKKITLTKKSESTIRPESTKDVNVLSAANEGASVKQHESSNLNQDIKQYEKTSSHSKAQTSNLFEELNEAIAHSSLQEVCPHKERIENQIEDEDEDADEDEDEDGEGMHL